MLVLVVEDEVRVRSFMARGLTEDGYRIWEAEDGDAALKLGRHTDVDAILLDWMLPQRSGLEVLRQLRAENVYTPIIMVTAKDQLPDVVEALNAGADDFLVKPCSFEELSARLRALLRRTTGRSDTTLSYADVKLDPRTRKAERAGKPLGLTTREFSLLQFLLEHAGETVPKQRILEAVWERDLAVFSNVVEVYIRSLRSKLDDPFEKPLIHTTRGLGYRLQALEE